MTTIFDVSNELLDSISDLAEQATPGPWMYFPKPKYNEHHVSIPIAGSGMRLALFEDGCKTERPEQDAKYIAAVNPDTVLKIVRYAKEAKHNLSLRTPAGQEKVIKCLVAALRDSEASLRKVTREGTQYDAMDIHETMSSIRNAIELASDSGVLKGSLVDLA